MKRNLELLSKIILAALSVVALFKLNELCFWLMSAKSTFYNIGGLLLIVIAIACISLFTINKIKTK